MSKRRLFVVLASLLLVLITLLYHQSSRHVALYPQSSVEDQRLSVASDTFPAEDETWAPPDSYDSTKPVFLDFPSQDARFASGIANLTSDQQEGGVSVQASSPYPDYGSPSYRRQHPGSYVSCIGPQGVSSNGSLDDHVRTYNGRPQDFPDPSIGFSETVSFKSNTCFERYGRFGAYGLRNSSSKDVNWDQVDWRALQRSCLDANSDRFDLIPRPVPGQPLGNPQSDSDHKYVARTAIIFRSHDKMEYTPDVLRNMRAVITELTLKSGGEYEAFLLVQIKDLGLPIFEDPDTYQRVRNGLVPREFWNMTILWSEGLWPRLYPLLPPTKLIVHMSQWLPVQYFQSLHPQFDYYWNWEMDVRYTGHYYELLSALDDWTRKQPRKGLWERNARFYIPRIHGAYHSFRDMVQARYQNSSNGRQSDSSIWGPHPHQGWTNLQDHWLKTLNTKPPRKSPTNDNYQWGVGEPADLVTLLPMFNPQNTWYVFTDDHYNYGTGKGSAGPPRRTTIITFYRLSSRLLYLMQLENTNRPGHHASSETWAQTVALHYGLKAVSVPHGLYQETKWPARALEFVFNNGDRHSTLKWYGNMDQRGEGSGGAHSVFGLWREGNFDSSTWYYQAQFGVKLYKRWLGYEVDGIGGKQWEARHGTYCLPPMLLHPIKAIDDPADAANPEQASFESTTGMPDAEEARDALHASEADSRIAEGAHE